MFENLGPYKILERIGAGPLGDVYRARDARRGLTVAIEVLPESLSADPGRRAGFVREAQASIVLSHPNIAVLYEIDEDQGRVFFVFEAVPGQTLQAAIGTQPMNPRRAIHIGHQIADALADAHAHGIYHRGLKPASIIVSPNGNAKVLDFGLAAWIAGAAGRGTAAASVAYLSPEQVRGGIVDHYTDIFSLGTVLFEMLTGALPFNGKTAADVVAAILQSPSPAPSSKIASLPREIDHVVGKALMKDPEERYDSAAALAGDLRAIAGVLEARRMTGERS